MRAHINSPKISVVLSCVLLGFPLISETVYTPSLPSIAASLNASVQWVEWTLSVYFIGFAVGVGAWGILADKIGRRPVMLLGLAIYCLGSLGCLLATDITILLAWRAIQALGASVGSVITQTMLRDTLEGKALNRLFSIIGASLAVAPAIGPFCGSWLDLHFGWRANFAALLALGISLLCVNYKILPETRPLTQQPKIKLHHLALKLMLDKKVVGCMLLVAAFNGILFSFFAEGPFILMELMGFSATQYGLVGLVLALAGLLGSLVSHRLQQVRSSVQIIGLGCGLVLVAMISLLSLGYSGLLTASHAMEGGGLLLGCLFIFMFGGFGLAIPNLLSMALVDYKATLGRAGAIFGLSYYLLIAGFTALMGYLHDGTTLRMPWYFLLMGLFVCLVYLQMLWLPRQRAVHELTQI